VIPNCSLKELISPPCSRSFRLIFIDNNSFMVQR
jgi:hypothetical protein